MSGCCNTHIHSDAPALLPEDGDLTGVCSELKSQNKQTQEMHSGVFSNRITLVMYTFTLLVSVYHCMQEPLHVRHINDYSHAQNVSTICGHETYYKDDNSHCTCTSCSGSPDNAMHLSSNI